MEAVCAACHASGAKGAPKIGDQKAWSKRASQGLTSLTQNALKGIREMPSHGGSSKLTDLEIGRAVAYMVNQSGGKWMEPASAKDMAAERSGAAGRQDAVLASATRRASAARRKSATARPGPRA